MVSEKNPPPPPLFYKRPYSYDKVGSDQIRNDRCQELGA